VSSVDPKKTKPDEMTFRRTKKKGANDNRIKMTSARHLHLRSNNLRVKWMMPLLNFKTSNMTERLKKQIK